MAIRDPHFWKRFSAAIHASEAEEAAAAAAAQAAAASTTDSESGGEKSKSKRKSVFPGRGGKVERTPSWLERQQAKKARRTLICWLFWFLFAGLVGAVVAVLLVLRSQGYIK